MCMRGDRLLAMSAASGGGCDGIIRRQQIRLRRRQPRQALLIRNQQMYGIEFGVVGEPGQLHSVWGPGVCHFAGGSAGESAQSGDVLQRERAEFEASGGLDKNGQELFKPVMSGDLEIAKQGGVAFVGSPLVTAQGVFVLARRMGTDTFTNLYLCRINRTTGAVDWTRYLCGAAAGQQSGNLMAQFQAAAAPAFADDTVYVTTGQGVDAAVDGPTGRVRWLTLTSLARQARGTSVYDGSIQTIPPAWKFNAPIVTGEKLVTLWSRSRRSGCMTAGRAGRLGGGADSRGWRMREILAGVIGDNAVLVGSNIQIVSLTTGKLMVDPDSVALPNQGETGKMMGRPFLTKKFLYMPMEKALVMVDLETGKDTNFAAWPKDEKGAGVPSRGTYW